MTDTCTTPELLAEPAQATNVPEALAPPLASLRAARASSATQRTVPEMFLERVAATPEREAFSYQVGDAWQTLTWKEAGARVRAIASGLRALDLAQEGRCAILSSTRIEWILADLGVLCAGGATTTIYPVSTAEECAFILTDADCTFAFVEDATQLAKLVERRAQLPKLQRVIVFDGDSGYGGWVISLAELCERGGARDMDERAAYERIARSVRSDALATLIYTSGTTGQPKGVELTHDAWVYVAEAIEALGLFTVEDRQYLWLPLAHSFGKAVGMSQIRIGYATAIQGDVNRMAENLAIVCPSFVCGVPRVFEKIQHRMLIAAEREGKLKQTIFRLAFAVGRRASKLRREGRTVPTHVALADVLADRLVFRKLRERFGGRLRFFICGSAPLSLDVIEFFHAAKILVLEGYGLTESSAVSSGNVPQRYRLGSVGRAVPGTEIKAAAEDGELLIRSRGVMRGYHNLDQATREVLRGDGWLRTGDIGTIDEDGFVFITDRKKDLIKTATGKYVAPQEIEGKIKATCPLVSQVFVHGDKRSFISALLTLDEDSTREWAKTRGLGALSYTELVGSEQVQALVRACVEQTNRQLAKHKAIRKFVVLPREFSMQAGELTPSLKLKRKAIEQNHAAALNALYEADVDRSAL